MATNDDTSKSRRSRRNPSKTSAASARAVPLKAADLPPSTTTPGTLEAAIENAQMLMVQLRNVLHCLSDVLLYSDDPDAVMHAEVARSAAGWALLAAAELDLEKLQPLIEALRRRVGGTPSDGEPYPTNKGLYQVREPRPVYSVMG